MSEYNNPSTIEAEKKERISMSCSTELPDFGPKLITFCEASLHVPCIHTLVVAIPFTHCHDGVFTSPCMYIC